jgi:outer membrane protein TolC
MKKRHLPVAGIGRIALLAVFLFCLGFPAAAAEDLSLEQAVQLALERNERALAAGEQQSASEARLAQARSYFLPTLSLTGDYIRRPSEVERSIGGQSYTVQKVDALAGYLTLDLSLFDPAALPAYRQAWLENKAQRYSSAEDRRRLSFEVAAAFLSTLTIDQVLEATGHRFGYAARTLEAARARFAAGLVSVNDVTRAELEYATAEMGSTQAQGQVQTAYLQLGYLLDTAIEGKLAAPELLLAQAEQPAAAAVDLLPGAQELRLDLRALSWHAKAQKALVLEPSLSWLPSLNLTYLYRYTNESGLTGKSTNWSVTLEANWAIFDGLKRIGRYKERKALARLAELDLRVVERKLELEVRDSLVSLSSQQASLKKALVALDAARKNAAEIAELYRQGLSNALQVADANVSLFEAEVEVARQRNGLALALLNLRAAQGLDPFGKEPPL